MDDVVRTEYPGLLATMMPGQAVSTLNERVKRINRINVEIADWLQERRRVEEQYVLGLRRLAQHRVPNTNSDLGVFHVPWMRILESVDRIAKSHHLFAERVEKDVEFPLRAYQQRRDYQNMSNISANLAFLARDLDDAQDKAERLNKRGARASSQKVEAANSRLESASQQWESQAPFVFESLQALDEARINQLRDLLTQYQTHEASQAQRAQDNAVEALAAMLEISTDKEIKDFARRSAGNKSSLPSQTLHSSHPNPVRFVTRRLSMATAAATAPLHRPLTATAAAPPLPPAAAPGGLPTGAPAAAPTAAMGTGSTAGTAQLAPPPANLVPTAEDGVSDHDSSAPADAKPESKLRRLGTMFGTRRRQSVYGGVAGPITAQRTGPSSFGRTTTNHSRGVSPRPSMSNLQDNQGRLSALDEMPDRLERDAPTLPPISSTNGVSTTASENPPRLSVTGAAADLVGINGGTYDADIEAVAPPPGPPPQQQAAQGSTSPTKDEEGFSVRAPMNDPISEAQREAAGEEADQLLKLNIQNKPIEEEDPEAKQAALSSVANTLKAGTVTRRSSTLRGRRDNRNTLHLPTSTSSIRESHSDGAMVGSPPLSASSFSRPTPMAALASESSVAGTSDTQSVRSGNSLGSMGHVRHPEMTGPGLNGSVIETVSAVFEDGEVTSASMTGEVALVKNASQAGGKAHETIRIKTVLKLERLGPNRIFVHSSSADQPQQFTLDVSHLAKTTTAFSYRVCSEDADAAALGARLPLFLKPTWKPQGEKLGLLLQYHLNPTAQLSGPLTLHNVVLVVTYDGNATTAQTRPGGTHLRDKHLVYCRLGDVTLTTSMQKMVCLIVGTDGVAPTPGHVEARWECVAAGTDAVGSGISISRLNATESEAGAATTATADGPFADDPFADDGLDAKGQNWVSVPLQRRLVSGKYESK
ncbi:Fes/CIP4 domain-containing protein [Ophiocordyceps camponoti-floridani]|uniref:Fes/CIP4 domain-containing protein n=1 Tax=Ophiocordyceps camponoti-floridani TaxID=2030778 RepID=A0A8H4VBN3_9HYPO|nr:Fes/CIP4 domain-containing protein [Ophiocordyceps camponoti-floridani]